MNIKQIEDIYREMGIGSREERERFLQWQYTDSQKSQSKFIIIIDTDNTTDPLVLEDY